MEHASRFLKVQLFQGLREDQVERVVRYLQEVVLPEAEFIIRENTSGDTLYILYEGTVRVTKKLVMDVTGSGGEDKNLATLKGDYMPCFGESGLVGSGMRNANVQAVTECHLYQLTKDDFDKIALEDIQAAYIIMRNVSKVLDERLDATNRNVVKLATALSLSVGGNR